MKARANRAILPSITHGHAWRSVRIPTELGRVIEAGVALVDGCYLARALLEGSASARRDLLPDRTGYECYVNHLHPGDYATDGLVAVSLSFLSSLSKLLLSQFPECRFQGVVPADEAYCDVRFHCVGPMEAWCSDDLDEYTEGVCAVELVDPEILEVAMPSAGSGVSA